MYGLLKMFVTVLKLQMQVLTTPFCMYIPTSTFAQIIYRIYQQDGRNQQLLTTLVQVDGQLIKTESFGN